MEVLVTGATGVLGRPTVRQLVGEGHRVRGLARSAVKADLLRSLGAEPVTVDLFDPTALRRAVEGAEAVLHLATNIPPLRRFARMSSWETTNRLRAEVTPLLVDACLDAGVGRLVKESLAFVYEDGGDRWLDESTPVVETPTQKSVFTAERAIERFTAAGGTGVVLRFGMFYGPDASTTDDALRFARLRIAFPVVGRAEQYHASVHSDDAASATVAALQAPSGTYNAAGTPSTKREFADAFSDAFVQPHLRILPERLVRLTSRGMLDFALRSQRVSSARLTEATGWQPAHPDVREGWAAAAEARAATPRR